MKIQLITNRQEMEGDWNTITISPLNCPLAIDEYDVNIIDLSDENLWINSHQPKVGTIDAINDFDSIKTMVEKKRIAKIVYVFPQNCNMRYKHPHVMEVPLKDCLELVGEIVRRVLPSFANLPSIIYENSNTIVSSEKYQASFYFDEIRRPVTYAISNKITTIERANDVFITSLNILNNAKELSLFLNNLFEEQDYNNKPEWINDVYFYDDIEIEERISKCNSQIAVLQDEIIALKERQANNDRIKSILYSTGDVLVKSVFNILEEILDYDLSTFKDEKREDFLITKDRYTIIGEIKGVNSNVKYDHITQVEVHKGIYLDEKTDDELQTSIHQILIICPFREKPVNARKPINTQQIKLAERNGCLIVTTDVLLKLYESFLNGNVTPNACEKLFIENAGLLTEEMMEKVIEE